MRIALIADTYPPLRTSGAVQVRDLCREFARQGHHITVMLPAPRLSDPWLLEEIDGVQVLRLRAPSTKDISYFRRTLAELVMSYSMLRNLNRSPTAGVKWDAVLWYVPSIFHGPLARALKTTSNCAGYLIVRDIFPEWAVDTGLMGKGLPYWFFRVVARLQYEIADIIGVQTAGNLQYFRDWARLPGRRIEVLPNWVGAASRAHCSIRISHTHLAGRRIFVYAGNMGVAQGMDILLDLASRLQIRSDVGFIFVGRGSEARRLSTIAKRRQLDNVLFFDEIDPDEIPALYAQCDVGLLALDPRHRTHNIPGKFLTYMQSGLPVLANVNPNNDLVELIRNNKVGMVSEQNSVEVLHHLAEALLGSIAADRDVAARCTALYRRCFSPETAVRQIVKALAAHPRNAMPSAGVCLEAPE